MTPEQIEAALGQDRLFLLLQPVVGAHSLQPAFYEALARVRRTDGSTGTAASFIELAENANIIERIDRRTLRNAVALLLDSHAFDLSLNISSLTTSDFAWIMDLQELTSHRPGLARRLIVEITETSAIPDIDRTLVFVDMLRELGCRIAIDDFGAGHTNAANLRLIRPDIVKIDHSLVQRCSRDATPELLHEVLNLAQVLGFETVAEGVEAPDKIGVLADLGVTYLQGFYFGAPSLPTELLGRGTQDRS